MAGNGDRDYRRSDVRWRGRELSVSTDSDFARLLHEAPAGLAGDAIAARWVGERISRVKDERMITGHGSGSRHGD
jgi:hypothetical protein